MFVLLGKEGSRYTHSQALVLKTCRFLKTAGVCVVWWRGTGSDDRIYECNERYCAQSNFLINVLKEVYSKYANLLFILLIVILILIFLNVVNIIIMTSIKIVYPDFFEDAKSDLVSRWSPGVSSHTSDQLARGRVQTSIMQQKNQIKPETGAVMLVKGVVTFQDV